MKFFVLALILSTSAWSGEISLSFDDAPRGGGYFTGPRRAELLIDKLKAHKLRAIFYANSGKLNKEGRKRLQKYATAGHGIANHTHSHLDINKVPVQTYQEDIQKAHETLSLLPGFVPYFRYPFLREGHTYAIRNPVRATLNHLGYQDGYVTVDNYDWYLDALFQKTVRGKKEVNFEALENLYVKTLWECIEFYDQMALRTLNRSPRHVLLLHENDLAALYIDKLIEFLKMKGWKIISPESSYRDPISAHIPKHLFHSQGRVAAIAAEMGDAGPFYHPTESRAYMEKLFKEQVLGPLN